MEWPLQPMQQFGDTSGQNAADPPLIIDAMGLLRGQAFLYPGQCLAARRSTCTCGSGGGVRAIAVIGLTELCCGFNI